MDATPMNTQIIERYLAAVASRKSKPDDFAGLLHPEMIFTERPNMFSPAGSVRGLTVMFEGMERGHTFMASQQYEVRDHLVVDAEHVVTRVIWRAETAVDLGPLPAGTKLQADSAMFFEFRDGLIYRQENFDCFSLPETPAST